MPSILEQFRRIDAPKREQSVHIEFAHEIVPDQCPDTSYLEQEDSYERREAYRRGEFVFVGVRAVAHVLIPAGGDSFTCHTLRSAGCWGVESDSDESHFDELAAEERSDLERDLGLLARAIIRRQIDAELAAGVIDADRHTELVTHLDAATVALRD